MQHRPAGTASARALDCAKQGKVCRAGYVSGWQLQPGQNKGVLTRTTYQKPVLLGTPGSGWHVQGSPEAERSTPDSGYVGHPDVPPLASARQSTPLFTKRDQGLESPLRAQRN